MHEEMELDLTQILRIIKVRWTWIATIFFVAVVLATWFSFRMTPIYESTASLIVKPENQSPLQDILAGSLGPLGKNDIQNNVEIIKSRTVAERTIKRLRIGIVSGSKDFRAFREAISVQPIPNTDVIKVSFQSPNPRQAQQVANTLVDVFEELTQLNNQHSARAARTFVEAQLGNVAAKLVAAEDALVSYKQQEKIVEPSEEARAEVNKMVELEKMAAENEIGLMEAETRSQELRKRYAKESPTVISAQTMVSNPLIQQYKSRLVQLETELAAAREKYTDKHPTVVSLLSQIEEVKSSLKKELSNILGSETTSVNPVHQELTKSLVAAETEALGLRSRLQGLRAVIKTNEAKFAGLPQKEVELLRLTRDQEVTQAIYTMLLQKQEEIQIQEAMKVAGIQRVDPAIVSDKPVKPNKRMNVVIAGILGLFVGCGLVFLMEVLDTTVKTPEQAEQILGLAVLGQVPKFEDIQSRRSGNRHHGSRQKKEKHSGIGKLPFGRS